jgi:hypothetical protein
MDAPLVIARRAPRDWRRAAFRRKDLRPLRLEESNLGAPSVLVAETWCHRRVRGEPLHPCRFDAKPHKIRVYICRSDNEGAFDELMNAVDADGGQRRPRADQTWDGAGL